ncbi:hypothetical protein GCM10009039_11900 [Halocalculus aciditolerans]|uniref:MYM-type domain-containing protein n=1 Tax=Halocalculus aciditolerans TaxID=1383812 RepID=A0A830FAJ2_9EURY|nr:hypothetical protein GCM10009039_11900 [Halocalculus aciditolerans]
MTTTDISTQLRQAMPAAECEHCGAHIMSGLGIATARGSTDGRYCGRRCLRRAVQEAGDE